MYPIVEHEVFFRLQQASDQRLYFTFEIGSGQ